MTNDGVRSCPFCGGEAQIKYIQKPFMHGWVGCPSCKIYKQWQHSPKEAVEIWNRREMPNIDEYLARWSSEKEGEW